MENSTWVYPCQSQYSRCVALAPQELGTVIHCSDFKFDQTPIDGRVTDLYKLAQLGNEGVLCLLSDSTNAERPGYTESERTVRRLLPASLLELKGGYL